MTAALRKQSLAIVHHRPVALEQLELLSPLQRWSHRLNIPTKHGPFIRTKPIQMMQTKYPSPSTRSSMSLTSAEDGGKPGSLPERPVLLPQIISSYYKTRMFRIQMGRPGAIWSGWSYVISKCDTTGFRLLFTRHTHLGIGRTGCLP